MYVISEGVRERERRWCKRRFQMEIILNSFTMHLNADYFIFPFRISIREHLYLFTLYYSPPPLSLSTFFLSVCMYGVNLHDMSKEHCLYKITLCKISGISAG